jgi:hypothetical protein
MASAHTLKEALSPHEKYLPEAIFFMKKNPLRVGLVATVTEYGGAEKVVLSLLKYINRELFDVVPIIFTRSACTDNEFFTSLYRMKQEHHLIFANKYRLKFLNPIMNMT